MKLLKFHKGKYFTFSFLFFSIMIDYIINERKELFDYSIILRLFVIFFSKIFAIFPYWFSKKIVLNVSYNITNLS